jgi:acyl dehydratase
MTEQRTLNSRRGLYFEEFEVGQSITSAGRTVTEADVVNFAALSGDWTTIHTDAIYAAQHPLGQRVAHGLLGLSIASGLAVRLGFLEETVLAFREIGSWKFSQPIYLGDTIHVQATVIETRPVRRLGGGQVTFNVQLLNQDDKVVQHGTWGLLVLGHREEGEAPAC